MYTAGAAEGVESGEGLAFPIRLWGLWSVVGLQRSPGRSPAANDFVAFWACKTTLVALKISYSGSLAVINFCVSTLKTAMWKRVRQRGFSKQLGAHGHRPSVHFCNEDKDWLYACKYMYGLYEIFIFFYTGFERIMRVCYSNAGLTHAERISWQVSCKWLFSIPER